MKLFLTGNTFRICTVLICLVSHTLFAQTYKVEEVSYKFVIQPIEGINSKYDEFSPVLYDDQIVFTSGREANLVLKGENNWKKTGFYNVFSAGFKENDSAVIKVEVPALFAKELSNNNHSGPVCFAGDSIVYFTQLTERKKGEKEVRFPQLYQAKLVNGKWTNISQLPFCQSDYSFGHPSWDPAKKHLYFSSNMEGGKGGNDIYRVKLNSNGEWGELENLMINSVSDEMFPFIIGNDLFFASDREGGQGDLDIYWKILGTKEPLQNLEQLNSEGDDHGLYITADHSKGWYAKRTNNQDDLFQLQVTREVRVTNELAGKFTYRNLGTEASGLELQLLHEDDIIFEVEADSNGEFAFRELPHENYTIKTKTTDNLELVLYDKDGNPNTYLIQDGEGKFQYKKVSTYEAGTLTLLEEMNPGIWLDYTDITGQFIYENIAGAYGDSLKVMLVDEDGNIIFTQYSDKRGNFTFYNIPTDQNYTITTEDEDEDLFLLIYDQDGNVYTQLKQNEKAQFTYKKIKPDLSNNLQVLADEDDVFETKTGVITGNFNYKKLEGDFNNGLTVYLYSEDGILLDSTVTNTGGQFMFRGLDPDETYLFKMKENDPKFKLDEFNLYVEDRYGKVLADLYRADDGFYRLRQIDTETNTDLAQISESNESEFNLETNETVENTESTEVVETTETIETPENEIVTGEGFNIYFDRNSSYANLTDYQALEQLISEMKSNSSIMVNINGFADSRAPDNYNLWLSERRGNRVKDFMIDRGIPESRISVSAFGESKLVNSCSDGNACPEEEHAKNRRVEVIISGR